MSTSARHFAANTDKIVLTPSTVLSGALNFGLHFAFKLDSSITPGVIFSQWDNTSPNDAIIFFYIANPGTGFPYPDPAAANVLELYTASATGTIRWVSQFDPFAGMAGDGLEHVAQLEWSQYDVTRSNESGYSILTIDGTSYASVTDGSTGHAGCWQQVWAVGTMGGIGTSSAILSFGDSGIGSSGFVGMALSDLGLWAINSFGANAIIFSATDIANFDALYDAQVIETGTQQIDVLPITGASPELGFKGALTGTITGTTVVAGPPLWPPLATTATLNHGGVAHTPGALTLTLAWAGGNAAASSVTFTPSAPIGTFSPSTITLTSSGSSTGTAVLTIPSGQTLGSYSISLTNPDHVLPESIPYSLVTPTAQVLAAKVSPNGNMLWLYGADISGNASAVTGADFSLSTIVKNGGSPISLASLTPLHAAYDNWCWTFIGQPAQDIQIGDTNARLRQDRRRLDTERLQRAIVPLPELQLVRLLQRLQHRLGDDRLQRHAHRLGGLHDPRSRRGLHIQALSQLPRRLSEQRPVDPRHGHHTRQLRGLQRLDHGQLRRRPDRGGQLR